MQDTNKLIANLELHSAMAIKNGNTVHGGLPSNNGKYYGFIHSASGAILLQTEAVYESKQEAILYVEEIIKQIKSWE